MSETVNTNQTLSETLKVYTKKWKWFVVGAIIAILLATIYLRYATPQYAGQAKIHIIEEKNASSELAAFSDLDILGVGGTNKVEDEIEILNSRSNFIEVVKDLKLNIRYNVLGNVKTSEVYRKRPFNINFIANDSIINNSQLTFYVDIQDSNNFGFNLLEDGPVKIYSYGKNIETPIGDIVLTPNTEFLKQFSGKRIFIEIMPIFTVAEAYQLNTLISAIGEKSNIINIELTDPIPQKSIDILNGLINEYNENGILDKKIIADRTSNFIDDRIKEISGDLTSVDQDAQDFKTSKGVTDIANESNIALNLSAANRQELENAKTQLNIANGMNQILSDENGFDVIPSNVGLSDPSIANTTAKYNELALERKRLLKSADEQNPIIVNLDEQLAGLKGNIKSSLSGMERNLGMQVNNLSGQLSRINSKIYSAPSNSRQLRDIERQQQTTESLFLYLLQKREESQIAMASSSPKSKVIDSAHLVQQEPVKPKNGLVYLSSLILGLLVPFGFIYAKDLLDTKIHNKHSLEKFTNEVPVLGELPRLSKKDSKIIINDDRSVLAEALRIIRANLDFLIKTKHANDRNKNNIIYVTSSTPGEGKTFVSSNLSMILASTDKKVLLVGADIRNPKLYSFFSGDAVDKLKTPSRNKDAGLTEFLLDDTIQVKDIIRPMLVHHNTIDVIYSGKIPPNPAELLLSTKVNDLLKEVSEMYDYVIVDTAPMMVVSDTLMIAPYADHIIYVTRAGVTDETAVKFPLSLRDEGKLKGISFVVNDVTLDELGYGGKYGYGYSKTSKKWWKF
ncbi:GumC family protein [Maribacter stanieri]|uniref:non-specific protein-tyrosine kinase n=1 Tax=Maribacter stanieri TaxID=440514 RepID=A0A1I6JSS3_9FLAO|nr:tyrosine-protein kinase family protein [Maribacter stanieri]SFR82035.1 capsular exopolysaccharide family [Maribacter stanieri]